MGVNKNTSRVTPLRHRHSQLRDACPREVIPSVPAYEKGEEPQAKENRRRVTLHQKQVSDSSAPTQIDFGAGSHIDAATQKLAELAHENGHAYSTTFNGITLIATPGDTPTQVKAPFDKAMREAETRAQDEHAIELRRRNDKLKDVVLISTKPEGLVLDSRGLLKADGGFFSCPLGDINLITPEQLKDVPEGTVLYSISGTEAVVGVDRIDGDTRGGFLAYGFLAGTPETKVNSHSAAFLGTLSTENPDSLGFNLVDLAPAQMTDMALRDMIRGIIDEIERSNGLVNLQEVVQPLRDAGITPKMHTGDSPDTFDARKTMEWYAGSLLDVVDSNSLFAMNSIINCCDKFTKVPCNNIDSKKRREPNRAAQTLESF